MGWSTDETRSQASDEKPLLDTEPEGSTSSQLYEILDEKEDDEGKQSDHSPNDTKAKQLVPLKATRTPLERYESGRWILFTAFTVLGVIVFLLGMAGIASIGNSPVELRFAEDGAMNNQSSQGEEQNQTSVTEKKQKDGAMNNQSSQGEEQNQTLITEKKQKEADAGIQQKPEMPLPVAIKHTIEERPSEKKVAPAVKPPPIKQVSPAVKPPVKPPPIYYSTWNHQTPVKKPLSVLNRLVPKSDEKQAIDNRLEEAEHPVKPAKLDDESSPTKQSVPSAPLSPDESDEDDDAIEKLIESAARYAEDLMQANNSEINGRLESVFFKLKSNSRNSNPRKILALDFGGGDESDVEKDEFEETDPFFEDEFERQVYGDDAVFGGRNNIGEPVFEDNDNDLLGFGQQKNDTEGDMETWLREKMEEYDDDNDEDDDNDDEKEVDMDRKIGFLANFWDYVKKFAMETLQITTNIWDNIFNGGDEEEDDEDGEAEKRKEADKKLASVEVQSSSSLGNKDGKKEAAPAINPSATLGPEAKSESTKRSQLKRLVDKVKAAVRRASDRHNNKSIKVKNVKL